MRFPSVFALSALVACAYADCDAATRLKYANQVVEAYNSNVTGETYTLFNEIPFGVPTKVNGACDTLIYPNGGPPVLVAYTGQGVANFGVETRQVFSSVTGRYVDFPDNKTALINTNVTLGARSEVPVPVTFTGHVFLDYNDDCRIYAVRAFAQIPTQLLGYVVNFDYLSIPNVPEPVRRRRRN